MKDSVTLEQMGKMDSVVLASQLQERGVVMSADDVAGLSDEYQRRTEAWLSGDRCFPRVLLSFCEDENNWGLLIDSESFNPQSLAEEIADSLQILGVTVGSPDAAYDEIAGFTDGEVEAAAEWTLDAYVEAARAAADKREVQRMKAPDCIMRLLAIPVEALKPEPVPSKAETREEAITRLQAGLHEVRGRFLERQADFVEKSDAAKAAKKSLEDAQACLNDLIGELDEAINAEVWQARLPLKFDDAPESLPAKPVTDDPARVASVEQLVEHGISQKQAEKLLEADIETIAELEKRIREFNGWFAKVKGIGQSAADKVGDALMAWRNKHGYGQ